MKPKLLIASGCSFTFEPWCWPSHLAEGLEIPELRNRGMASQGNPIIARKAMYAVQAALKEGYKPEDILVGVMWSGIDRQDFYTDDVGQMSNVNGWIENPTSMSGIPGYENWEILNAGWQTKRAKLWYTEFNTHIGSVINTLEYMVMIQLYFESVGVKYFMTHFMDFYDKFFYPELYRPDVKMYADILNMDNIIKDGEYEWVRDNMKEDVDVACGLCPDDLHPNADGHIKYTKEVIIPFLKENVLNG